MFNQYKEKATEAAKSATSMSQKAGKQFFNFAGEKLSNVNVNDPRPGTLAEECAKAARILEQFILKEEIENGFDTIIPVSVIKEAKGLAIFTVVKAGFLWSVRAGSGIVVARLPNGKWSPPSMIATGGVGIGPQVGADITDVVLILNSEEAVAAFSKGGNITLGGSIAVSAGPIGAGGEAAVTGDVTKGKIAPTFSYSKSKGIFAGNQVELLDTIKASNQRVWMNLGMSIEGTALVELSKTNTSFYGAPIKAEQLLKGTLESPPEAKVLYDMIERAENRDPY
ncbi:hypothetical protein EC973_003260 [Apophysomyces ossiformis]|uniref:Ysc84 actin-binding domain-containing protein n=1 Tax=Apophysomyces ossiformis TaxID=679940 RepID=A0A8H7BZF7_9FUNG|nr:hypothetical protein EC973_003260 [Apophysomyces ossiformis]